MSDETIAEPDSVRFLAQYKPVASAFQLDGDGDGGQLTLIFDRQQIGPATQAWAIYAGDLFTVTLSPRFDRG